MHVAWRLAAINAEFHGLHEGPSFGLIDNIVLLITLLHPDVGLSDMSGVPSAAEHKVAQRHDGHGQSKQHYLDDYITRPKAEVA